MRTAYRQLLGLDSIDYDFADRTYWMDHSVFRLDWISMRIAGGRERHLRSMQPLGLYIANSIFVGDYLTTEGQPPQEDYEMIKDMGFEITGSCI